ncbi:hypothetical protein IAD21_06048 [Abditibacteriota bacterium]|nr:hypothetical protein IAD21_06048 [Abditibacteriota bacterium]
MSDSLPNSKPRHSPRSRFEPKINARVRLEERDEQILCNLFLHRLMSRSQIERAHFSSTVRANARLRLLFDHGFVARYYPPYAPFGAQAVYRVGKAALPLISRRLEMDMEEVRRYFRLTQTPTFVEHTLAVVDLWLQVCEGARTTPGITLDLWLAEMKCRHEWAIYTPGAKWKEAFKPDGFFRLEHEVNQTFHSFFLECDLGHTSAKQFTGKLLTHTRYLESRLFEEVFGEGNFRTLIVTTGQRRLENLMALAQEHNSSLFWFTTFDQIAHSSLLGPIWRPPGRGHQVALIPD